MNETPCSVIEYYFVIWFMSIGFAGILTIIVGSLYRTILGITMGDLYYLLIISLPPALALIINHYLSKSFDNL